MANTPPTQLHLIMYEDDTPNYGSHTRRQVLGKYILHLTLCEFSTDIKFFERFIIGYFLEATKQ